ncbi:helix-turn-helix transcriptional regulator [Haloprofundus salilacus]|uniref:helix-turn-helix transcriptional regulator n=1 Tax=Haloprofundus salilacus TaxID=2876190 RepID=UPI003CCD94B9
MIIDEARYGLGIKRELEDYYSEDVNHGRLYPNLNDLVAMGLVEKTELDKRTNLYTATELGVRVRNEDADWVEERLTVAIDEEVA